MAKELTKIRGLGPVKRFGVRYGRTVKYRLANIEEEQKRPHTCPYCNKPKVKRVAYGIWRCKKCNSKFAGKAYAPTIVVFPRKETEPAEKGAE